MNGFLGLMSYEFPFEKGKKAAIYGGGKAISGRFRQICIKKINTFYLFNSSPRHRT
jgi:hypothetical protein